MANRSVPVMLAIACLVILQSFPGYRTVLKQHKVVIAGDARAHALAVDGSSTQPNTSPPNARDLFRWMLPADRTPVWRVLVFSAKPYDQKWLDEENVKTASDNYRVDIQYVEEGLSITTVSKARGFNVVCLFVNDEADQKVIDRLLEFQVKMIALRCAGHDKVDSNYAASKGIVVVRVPEYSPAAVAEHTVALMMSLDRHLPQAVAQTAQYNFDIQNLVGFNMNGKTVGFVGTGKIGLRVAEILTGFKCKLIAWTTGRHHQAFIDLGLTYVRSLDEIWVQSDIITLHIGDFVTPDGFKTKHIINRESIEKMKKKPMIINTGRGSLIDTEALLNGLTAGKISSAGLDVYERESGIFFSNFSARPDEIIDNTLKKLLRHPRVQVTAHMAFLTNEALDAIAKETINSIRCIFERKQLDTNVILPEVEVRTGQAAPAIGTSFLNLSDTNWKTSPDYIDASELL